MKIEIRNHSLRTALVALVIVVCVLAVVWVAKTYFGTLVAEHPTAAGLTSASRLDPGNSDYALDLGRLYEYSVMNARPDLAQKELLRAIRLNPYNTQAWLDLGTSLELEGDIRDAETCLQRVDQLAPRLPKYQWAVGNFYLLHGDVDKSFPHFKMVLAGNPSYAQAIYQTAWKASGNAAQILSELIPKDAGSELNYLNFLLSTHRLDEAAPVWNRIAKGSDQFDPAQAAQYIDALIGAHRASDAYAVWGVLRSKGLIPATDEATSRNLVENGDFENRLLGMGFGWRVAAVSGIYVGLDQSNFHSPGHSLLIQFPGTENFEYHNIYQYVPVLPDHAYQLTGFVKTEKITTDSGVRLEVRDAYQPATLDKYSDQVTGTSPSWLPLNIDFKTPSKTSLILVIIARQASQEFDNQISGKIWVDDVSLTLATSRGAAGF
ncbi:MAG: tetratricopeptide repeat protein [Terriglobia bacterium]